MSVVTSSNLRDAINFIETFVPGSQLAAPLYLFDTVDGSVTLQRFLPFTNTTFFPNRNPTVTLLGDDVTIDRNGLVAGTVTGIVFSSDNRGEIARIEDISFFATEFNAVMALQFDNDATATEVFERFIGTVIGTFVPLEETTLILNGFLRFVPTIDLGGGNDSIIVSEITPDVVQHLEGGAGTDFLTTSILALDGSAVVDIGTGVIRTSAGEISFSGFEAIRGSRFVNEYIGSARDDDIWASTGDDLISGGAGNDTLLGSSGDDTLHGDGGADTLRGNSGEDSITGGVGFDSLFGGSENDTIDGGRNADSLYGEGGNDLIFGGQGFDQLFGGAGDDTLLAGETADRAFGGGGNDLIRGGTNFGLTVDGLFGEAGDDTIFGEGGFDFLDGGDGNDSLDGGAQADNLYGRAGMDTLLGGDGLDRLFGGADDDLAFGGDGNDGLFGEAGNDTLNGGEGNDRFFGGSGDDVIDGGTGNDTINSGAGFDTITGGAGDDLLFGRFNADTFVFTDGHGNDTIADFTAANRFERIDLSGVSVLSGLNDLDLNSTTSGAATQVGADVVIETGSGSSILLANTLLADLSADSFIF